MTTTDIPKYGLGTWLMGGAMERDLNNDDQADIEAIRVHVDSGVKQIFTAQNYAANHTEKLVGEALSKYDRNEFMLNTAIRKEHSAYDDMMRSVEGSLQRLKVDYLDVVVHHSPIPEVEISESIRALNSIVDQGLAKGLAVSNYNKNSMEKAVNSTTHPILFNQVYYNLFVREVEEDGVLAYCQEQGVLIQAFRPLELGALANSGVSEVFDNIAKKYNLTNAQVALSWLTSQDGVVTISTTHSKTHLESNLAAVDTIMSKTDIKLLRAEFPVRKLEKNWLR